MSTDTSNLEEMKYNELKALAKERGLSAAGTKEDLIARLAGSDETATDAVEEKEEVVVIVTGKHNFLNLSS